MRTYIVDSFTNEMFKGNPAGVCLVNNELADNIMLAIAQELNLSETAFVKKGNGDNYFQIRYFSPKMEIPLCGHATLAAAKVLLKRLDSSLIFFKTTSGISLNVQHKEDQFEMEFPLYETIPAVAPIALLKALGIDIIENCVFNEETKILLLEITSDELLAGLEPDFSALVLSHQDINGVLVTAKASDDNYDFHSRYFWPWNGSNEDPVTGGTHTFLAKYWADKLNKKKLQSFQSSKRTGFMEVEILNDKRSIIRGNAVLVLEGEIKL